MAMVTYIFSVTAVKGGIKMPMERWKQVNFVGLARLEIQAFKIDRIDYVPGYLRGRHRN